MQPWPLGSFKNYKQEVLNKTTAATYVPGTFSPRPQLVFSNPMRSITIREQRVQANTKNCICLNVQANTKKLPQLVFSNAMRSITKKELHVQTNTKSCQSLSARTIFQPLRPLLMQVSMQKSILSRGTIKYRHLFWHHYHRLASSIPS